MLRYAKTLLELCESRFPSPRPSQRHNLVVIDGVMVLTLMQGDTYRGFNLSEVDLEREPESLADELATMLALPADDPPHVDLPPKQIPDDIA